MHATTAGRSWIVGLLFVGPAFLLSLFFSEVAGQTAMAQGTQQSKTKLLSKRAAEADCYRKLTEIVYGLELSSTTYVRDFVTESDEIRSHVDEYIKGIRLGTPRYYEDGMCEVDGEVTVAKLVTHLKQLHTAHYKGDRVHTTDFEKITQTVRSNVIRATGAGAARPDVAPGFESYVEPLPAGIDSTVGIVPDLWKSVPVKARLGAIRAAEVDAQRRLLERIKGLRLNSSTLVRDFVTESDEITTQANGIVVGASQVGRYLHGDELIVEVTLEVPVEKVFTRLKELHTEHYKGNRVTTTDIVHVQQSIERKMIRETGMGIPNERFLKEARNSSVTMPDWMGRQMKATGQGTDPAIPSAQGKLKAARAAELDAKRRLAEQIYGLTVDSKTTVKDYVAEHDELSAQVNAILAAAIVDPPRFEGEIAEVTVSMVATAVWSVINQHLTILYRHG